MTKRLARRRVLQMAGGLCSAPLLAGWRGGVAFAAAREGAPMLLQPVTGLPPAPGFSLPDLDGKIVEFAAFAGRPVVVNFWATWCPPCRAEIPSMQRAWQQLEAKGVIMLAVHVGGGSDAIWEFLTPLGVTFPVLIDATSGVSKAWRTVGLPTTYVTDPAARMALRAIGGREWDHPDIIASILSLRT